MLIRFFRPLLMDEKKDGDGGGGGGENKPDLAAQFAELKKQNEDLQNKLKALEKPPADDPDLLKKARDQKEQDQQKANDLKATESALRFTMSAPDFLKTNASLLPKNAPDIFKQAEKETYNSAIDKDKAIKAGLIQSFFEVQSNVDLLTPGLKNQLEDYLKLTNTGKQDKAAQVYEAIFEPAFEMLKRVKKAEAVGKGYGSGSGADEDYKNKMMALSTKHY
jgi:chemotaxis protein histidine kinase CheA